MWIWLLWLLVPHVQAQPCSLPFASNNSGTCNLSLETYDTAAPNTFIAITSNMRDLLDQAAVVADLRCAKNGAIPSHGNQGNYAWRGTVVWSMTAAKVNRFIPSNIYPVVVSPRAFAIRDSAADIWSGKHWKAAPFRPRVDHDAIYNPQQDLLLLLIGQRSLVCRSMAGTTVWEWSPGPPLCIAGECLNSFYWDWPRSTVYVTTKQTNSIIKVSHAANSVHIDWVMTSHNHSTIRLSVLNRVQHMLQRTSHELLSWNYLHSVQLIAPNRLAVFSNLYQSTTTCGHALIIEVNDTARRGTVIDALQPCLGTSHLVPNLFGGYVHYNLGLVSSFWNGLTIRFRGENRNPSGSLYFQSPDCVLFSYRVQIVPRALFLWDMQLTAFVFNAKATAATNMPIAQNCSVLLHCTQFYANLSQYWVRNLHTQTFHVVLPSYQRETQVRLRVGELPQTWSCALHWSVKWSATRVTPLTSGATVPG